MIRPLKDQPLDELRKLLKRETKAFIDGLENGLSVQELKAIRARMKEIFGIIEDKTKRRGSSSHHDRSTSL